MTEFNKKNTEKNTNFFNKAKLIKPKAQSEENSPNIDSYARSDENSSPFDSIQPEVSKNEVTLISTGEEENASVTLDRTIDRVFVFFENTKTKMQATFAQEKAVLAEKKAAFGKRCYDRMEDALDRYVLAVKRKNKLACASLKALRKVVLFVYKTHKGLSKIGNGISLAFARRIDKFDERQELFDQRMSVVARKTKISCHRMELYCERHRKGFIGASAFAVAAAVAIVAGINSFTVYEYMYNGKSLGVVKSQNDVYATVDLISDKIGKAYNAEINIDKENDISFKRVFVTDNDDYSVDSQEDVLNNLTYMKDMKVKGYAIVAEGEQMAIMDSKENAEAVLGKVKSSYLTIADYIDYKKVDFAESVKIEEVDAKLGKLESGDEVYNYMMTGVVEEDVHIFAQGDTIEKVAGAYGLTVEELAEINSDISLSDIQIGQKLKLQKAAPVLTVETVEEVTYIEEIPFEVAYEQTDTLFKDEQSIKSEGVVGQRQVTAEIRKENGVEISKTELSSTLLADATSQVVLVGTKERPALIGTGSYRYPINGRLTSGFGTRWGRMHTGIDLAAPTGTKIGASDGGKVIAAGYNGSLGYMVKIDHGGGRVTLYGHCSKLFVSAGDKVYQGQHIANVGSTGRSTGPHVHFEIQINGTAKNPLNYL